jgi:tight adherence protein B
MTLMLANTLAFLTMFAAVFAANAVVSDLRASDRRRVKSRIDERFRARLRDQVRKAPLLHDFHTTADNTASGMQQKSRHLQRLKFMLEQAGMEITPLRLLTLAGGLAIFLGLGASLTHRLLVILPAVALGAGMPFVYVLYRRRQRLDKIRDQLPEVFELMSRVLRAGQTISQALQAVADEFSQPVALEFLYCTEQMNLGLSAEGALRELGRRTGLLEIKIFVLAVGVHRQAGGNLAELLDKLATVVRERSRIHGMVRSLTAQGRLQAGILLSLPPAMFVVLLLLQRQYELVLLDHPLLIVSALGMMGAGALWIGKVINFDY